MQRKINLYLADKSEEQLSALESFLSSESELSILCLTCEIITGDTDGMLRPDIALQGNVLQESEAEVINGFDAPDLFIRTSDLLREAGVPVHIKGYYYIREAVIMVVRDVDIIRSITKTVYPAIADKFNSTASRVERAIRHAIEIIWSRGDADTVKRVLCLPASYKASRPTNSEFIAIVADIIRLSY